MKKETAGEVLGHPLWIMPMMVGIMLVIIEGLHTTATTDLHFGFDGATEDGKVAYYIQGGPGFVHTDSTDDTVTEISGKVGVSVAVADGADVYGEISGITGEDSSGDDIIDFGGRVGVKYTF